jgi:hypothetical protein
VAPVVLLLEYELCSQSWRTFYSIDKRYTKLVVVCYVFSFSHQSVSSSGASCLIFLYGGVPPERCRILQVKHDYFRGTDCHNLRWIRGRINALALNSNDTLQHVWQETLHTGDHSTQTQTIEIRPTNLRESWNRRSIKYYHFNNRICSFAWSLNHDWLVLFFVSFRFKM